MPRYQRRVDQIWIARARPVLAPERIVALCRRMLRRPPLAREAQQAKFAAMALLGENAQHDPDGSVIRAWIAAGERLQARRVAARLNRSHPTPV